MNEIQVNVASRLNTLRDLRDAITFDLSVMPEHKRYTVWHDDRFLALVRVNTQIRAITERMGY